MAHGHQAHGEGHDAPGDAHECCGHEHGDGHNAHGDAHGDAHGYANAHGAPVAKLTGLELGQQCLKEGDAAGAIGHLEEGLTQPGGDTVDAHLLLAEALWQKAAKDGEKGSTVAIQHYEAAAALAKASGDTTKEGMVALGHGFALSQLGEADGARKQLSHARTLAEADGNMGAVSFCDRLLQQVGAPTITPEEAVRATWKQFAETLAAGKSAVLFMRGKLSSPLDEESQRGVAKLRSAGCRRLEVVDVCDPGGAEVPEGLQGLSDSPHLAFPQLFLTGVAVEGWLDTPTAEELRGRLAEAGVELGEPGVEPAAEPCHGTGAFADGLEPWEVTLVEFVSKDGAGDWQTKATKLAEKYADTSDTDSALPTFDVPSLEAAWERLAPLVKERLEKQPEMPCGHSCNTCPTRHDCQLHDAVGSPIRDIEDLM